MSGLHRPRRRPDRLAGRRWPLPDRLSRKRPAAAAFRWCASASGTWPTPPWRTLPITSTGPAWPDSAGSSAASNARASAHLVMAGKVHKSVMYTPWRILTLMPDWRTVRFWYSSRPQDRTIAIDTLLFVIIDEFAADGLSSAIRPGPLPGVACDPGIADAPQAVARRKTPTSRFGWELAKEMGRLDVGQSVAVKERAVLAVEAIEGTDRSHPPRRRTVPGAGSWWSRLPSRSRTCASTCRPSAGHHRNNAEGRGPRAGHRGRQDHHSRRGPDGGPGGSLRPDHHRVVAACGLALIAKPQAGPVKRRTAAVPAPSRSRRVRE